jgi:hypothetical protein
MKKEKVLTPEQLHRFTGTENYHANPLYPAMKYTDGVKFFATEASAYWFLDIVGTEYHPIQTRGEPFIVVEMQVTHNTRNKVANIRVTDGGSRTLAVRRIDYTDCPQGFWKFYLENDVLSLPSEQ